MLWCVPWPHPLHPYPCPHIPSPCGPVGRYNTGVLALTLTLTLLAIFMLSGSNDHQLFAILYWIRVFHGVMSMPFVALKLPVGVTGHPPSPQPMLTSMLIAAQLFHTLASPHWLLWTLVTVLPALRVLCSLGGVALCAQRGVVILPPSLLQLANRLFVGAVPTGYDELGNTVVHCPVRPSTATEPVPPAS